jgi:hypothetical protein
MSQTSNTAIAVIGIDKAACPRHVRFTPDNRRHTGVPGAVTPRRNRHAALPCPTVTMLSDASDLVQASKVARPSQTVCEGYSV